MATSDPRQLLALHRELIVNHLQNREELAAYLLRRVRRLLKRRMPGLDLAIVNDAVEDAILGYLQRPELYKPSCSRLDTFILLAARRDALNMIRRLQCRHRAEGIAASMQPRLYQMDEVGLFAGRCPAVVDWLGVARTDAERAFLKARLAGERRTRQLACILGLSTNDPLEERRLVKRTRDRLHLRFRRRREAS